MIKLYYYFLKGKIVFESIKERLRVKISQKAREITNKTDSFLARFEYDSLSPNQKHKFDKGLSLTTEPITKADIDKISFNDRLDFMGTTEYKNYQYEHSKYSIGESDWVDIRLVEISRGILYSKYSISK